MNDWVIATMLYGFIACYVRICVLLFLLDAELLYSYILCKYWLIYAQLKLFVYCIIYRRHHFPLFLGTMMKAVWPNVTNTIRFNSLCLHAHVKLRKICNKVTLLPLENVACETFYKLSISQFHNVLCSN